jgi:hypothetical protein
MRSFRDQPADAILSELSGRRSITAEQIDRYSVAGP